MALERKDSVGDLSTTTGTGTFTLLGTPPNGRLAFTAFTTGATVRYRIATAGDAEWEVGEGVWTTSGATLTRVTVYASSNSGSLVSFSAGSKTVQAVMTAADLPTYCGCQAINNGTQSISSSSTTPVTFNSEDWDTDAIHSTSTTTSRFTVPTGKAGRWQFSWQATFASNATGQRIGFLRKNASGAGSDSNNVFGSADYRSGTASAKTPLRGTSIVNLADGDHIELFVYQDSGSALNIGGSTGGSVNAEVSVMEARFLG